MNSRSRNPLSLARLRRKKTRWPRPENSVGASIGLLHGRDHCWKAIGPARSAFEQLAPRIKRHLEDNLDSIPGSAWVTWSIYMIGSTPETAQPTIMFFCDELQPRR